MSVLVKIVLAVFQEKMVIQERVSVNFIFAMVTRIVNWGTCNVLSSTPSVALNYTLLCLM